MKIVEVDQVDPLKVFYVNQLALDFALTPEMAAQIRQTDPRPFPCLAIYAVEEDAVLGQERYDLVSCFGNSISDFPLSDYAKLVRLVSNALKPGGRFLLQYHDGSYNYIQGKAARSGVYQETPERITYRIKEYNAEVGAIVNIIRNEARGEEYPRQSYIYTAPVVQLIAGFTLVLEQHIVLEENHYLDIFTR